MLVYNLNLKSAECLFYFWKKKRKREEKLQNNTLDFHYREINFFHAQIATALTVEVLFRKEVTMRELDKYQSFSFI